MSSGLMVFLFVYIIIPFLVYVFIYEPIACFLKDLKNEKRGEKESLEEIQEIEEFPRRTPEEIAFMESIKKLIFKDFETSKKNRIVISYEEANEKLPVGSSKFFGDPDLPEDMEWPTGYIYSNYGPGEDYNTSDEVETARKIKLDFVAQFNLEELAQYDKDNLLPKKGLLSFFHSGDLYYSSVYDKIPDKDNPPLKVLYFEDIKNLKPRKCESINPECIGLEKKLTFKNDISVLSPRTFTFKDSRYVDNVYDDFNENIYKEYAKDFGVKEDFYEGVNQIFGNYWCIQSEGIEEDLEMFRKNPGLIENYSYSEHESFDPDKLLTKEERKQAYENWVLLLQMGDIYDEEKGNSVTTAAVGGAMYFWIRKDDLKAKRFDKVMITSSRD